MNVKEMAEGVNWNAFSEFPENTCTCADCEAVFRSHSKLVMQGPPVLLSQKPCPACGSHSLMRASSDPERQVLQ